MVFSLQVNGQRSPTDISIKAVGDSTLYERIPAKKKEVTVVCNELGISRDLTVTHSFSNGEVRPYKCNGLRTLDCGSQPRTCTRSVELEEEHTKFEKQTDPVELSNPTRTMLSSTVVTVLAPHLSGRPRRLKRFDGTSSSEAQGNLQDVTNTMENHTQERFQGPMDRLLTERSQAQSRLPFPGTRSNTVGWSTNSGPASLDYESKRRMIQTVSLDVNTGRMGSRNRDAGALNPVATNETPVSPFSPGSNEQRRNPQTGHQGELSSLNSKPTTSSLLLYLREELRVNSNGKNSNAASTLSQINLSPLSGSPTDRDGKVFTPYLSQIVNNNNVQERSKSLLSPSSYSYKTTETGSTLSPSSSNGRGWTTLESRFFPASPTNKDAQDAPFTQQPQTTYRTQTDLSCSKQAFLSGGASEMQQSCRGSDISKDLFADSSVSSTRHTTYDLSALQKTHSLPRRTTLTSTSWWKQVTQESGPPLKPNEATYIKDKPNTPVVSPCNDKYDLASPSPVDNKIFSSSILRDNNNTAESVYKGNMNLCMKTEGGTHNLKQRNAEDSRDHESDRLVKQLHGSNLNIREPQKPHSVPDVLSGSKISRATAQTILSHTEDLTKHDASNSALTAIVTVLPPTLLNPKSLETPTESNSKYKNNHCTSNTNTAPASPHTRNPQRFSKPSLSLPTTTLTSQALTSKTASGLPLTGNTKTSSSFYSNPVASQSSIHASSYTSSSSQTPKFTKSGNVTPLGFERSYASVPKPFHPKTVSSPIPTASALTKTNYSPVQSTVSTIYSSPSASHPSATTVPSQSLLTPPLTPALSSSPTTSLLTPPSTPVITSPTYSDRSNPKEGRTFSSSQEGGAKKLRPNGEAKRVRRVTWEDSVDLQHSEPVKVEKPEPSHVPTSSPSPSRSSQSMRAQSIFSFLRSSSPTTGTNPLCSTTPKTSSIPVVKAGQYRSLSSDSADLVSRERERSKQRPSDTMISDHGGRDTPRQERTPSVESGTVQCRASAPLSLPPDFSSGYKLRYSSPPYSALMSSRSSKGETKTVTSRSPLFQQPSQLNYTPHLSTHTDPVAVNTLLMSKPPLSPISLPRPLLLPSQNKTATRESLKCGVSENDQLNNNLCSNSQDRHNDQILLVNNRVNISSQSLPGDRAHSSSTFVTETLVYRLKSEVDTATVAPKDTTPLQHIANAPISMETNLSQQSHRLLSKEVAGKPHSSSDQGSSGSSSTGSQPRDGDSSNRRMKESVLGKSRFFSMESNNEQSPKRSRFVLKKSVSTPNTNLSRSESDRASKTNNKMDQVLNKLRQTFSTRRSDDDSSFPWKWKRASQTPSVSGSSDISNVSDATDDNSKTPEKREQERGVMLKDNEKVTDITNRWAQNRYTLTSPSASGSTMTGDKFYIWSERSTTETDQDEQHTCADHKSESKIKPHLTIHSPTTDQFDFFKDNRTDYQPANQFLSCRDPSPGRSSNLSSACPTQLGKSASSPRSPFSPFSSLSPVSFPSPDNTDDSVFYSPKLQRRRESSSPCEPAEGISLGGSRRSRASTGPPSASLGHDKESLASSYADLKYGIEPGRSFSVSSVSSSRPSGPGRISTGSRFMSVGDLSQSGLTCGGTSKDLDHWSVTSDWTTQYDCQPSKDGRISYFPSDPGKMRSRSLPRSLTRCLSNWSSGVSVSPPVNTTTSKPARLWSPNMNICHFAWDTEGPPTPPPTPPLSPASRRMSQPPSLSSPTFPSSSGAQQPADSQSSRGRLPSRGYISSLSTFEESSDSGSDTTTDDEYYLETAEGEEKETEL